MNPTNIKMMRRLYAIRDDKEMLYNAPVVISNDAVAARTFGDMVSEGKNPIIAAHPGDFALYFLGEFDAETGVLVPAENPCIIARASDFCNTAKE